MYQVTIKGRSIEELKQAVNDVHVELQGGFIASAQVEKNLEDVKPKVEEVKETSTKTEEASQPSVNGEVDSEGLPWDKRIHSSSRTQNGDGSWKKKRGVDAATLEQVKAELRGSQTSQTAEVPEVPINSQTPAVNAPAVTQTPTVNAPTVTPAPTPQATSGGHTLETFKQNFPMIIGGLISEGKISAEYVEQLNQHFGVQQIWTLNDQQKEEMFNSFVEFNLIQKVG